MIGAALAVAAIFTAVSPTANAGQVGITPDLSAGSIWNPGGDPRWNGFSVNNNLFTTNDPSRPWVRTQYLPQTVNLDSITVAAFWDNGHVGELNFRFRMCAHSPAATPSNWGCTVPHSCEWQLEANLPPTPIIGDRGVACPGNVGSFELHGQSAGGTGNGAAALSNARATISDYTAPTATNDLGWQTLNSAGWRRGTAYGGSNPQDIQGIGINNVKLIVDSVERANQDFACSTTLWVPCTQSVFFAPAFDTTTISDGPHNAHFTTSDLAGNSGQSPTFTFKVDNTKPDTPSDITPETDGEDGWASTNEFDATWTNGAETSETTSKSGLDKVVVDVDPTTAGQTDPGPITVDIGGSASGISATRDSVSGVTVPAVGEWTLRLSLIDRAGNVSNVGSDTGSDTTIGFDPNPPAQPAGQANGWIGRQELVNGYRQQWNYTAPPTANAPLCGWAGKVSTIQADDPGTTINVPGDGATRSWELPANLTEGNNYVNLRSVSCTGLASSGIESVLAPVDFTDPVPSYSGVQSGKWYMAGRIATIGGTDALSGMAGEPNPDSQYFNGAYIKYTVNGAGPATADIPRGGSGTVSFSGDGPKTLSFSPVDLAGNGAKPTVVSFGIDGSLPHGYFAAMDKDRPTLLRAVVADDVSGIDYAIISIRKQGDSKWINLPTSLVDGNGNPTGSGIKSGLASARFPDTTLPRGRYDIQVSSFDLAGNQFDTNKFQDGSSVSMSNPMRATTGINAKLFKALRKCGKKHCVVKKCTKKTKGTCYKVYKGKVVLVGGSTTVATAFNRGAIVNGVLSDENGKPLKNQPVVIATTEKISGKSVIVGTTTTDYHGIYGIRVPAGMSRTVKAYFPGTELREDATATANMGTQAKLKLKISKRHAYTGQTVKFSGKVTSFDGRVPAAGKIVALQFYAAKRWRPAVAVGHTDRKGKFSIKYKFDGKRVKAKIHFRVVAPSEDAWGHVFSTSKTAVIRLN